jgi:acetylornithine deacetylase/succinyl-diaminopimelate desuccinylase-like protein
MGHPSQTHDDAIDEAQREVVDLTSELIRIDTSNFGDSESTVGEISAAEWAAAQLSEVGWSPEVFTTTNSRRAGVTLRIPGTDASAPALLLHGHLDVVPAVAADWTHDPFGGEVTDGFVWGRGAVDMKDMDAMILAVARAWARSGTAPRRDIVILLLPDEEAGGRHGGHWLVDNRPDIFEGVADGVGEVGGFSVTVRDDLRLYPIQTAEKGIRWLTLGAKGRAGHGSMIHPDNATTVIAEAVAAIGRHSWPRRRTTTVDRFLAELADVYEVPLDSEDPGHLLERLGTLGFLVGATLQNTANPTMLEAGYKHNVIPGEASAGIDGRVLPGYEEEFDQTIRELVGDTVEITVVTSDIALEAPLDALLVEQMAAVLREEDPGARPVPYMISGGTDAKSFARLGIDCYGFSPLRMPAGLDYWRLFHGVDERVPVDGLAFGVRVLDRFLRAC